MDLMNKILNKSNSYKYYKTEFKKFSKKEKKYKNTISKLKKELSISEEEKLILIKENESNTQDINFLKQELIAKDNQIEFLKKNIDSTRI